MELFATDIYFILVDGEDSLWIDRFNAVCEAKKGISVSQLPGAELLGIVYGYVGILRVSITSDIRLVFIRQQSLIGTMNNLPIFRIVSVLAIPLEGDVEVLIENDNGNSTVVTPNSPTRQTQPGDSSSRSIVRVKVPRMRGIISKKVDTKVDKRMLEEFHKMFTEAESFYYSPQHDITNSLHRRQDLRPSNNKEKEKDTDKKEVKKSSFALWELADKRFFWNWYMVKSLINAQDTKLYPWIIPIIQGFIQYEPCIIEQLLDPMGMEAVETICAPIGIWLISRRSRYQAGTRYLRRGVDDNGKVANYVETEQIVVYKSHMFSFVQVRGSIPVFWSQSNSYKYRPPPKIEREDAETYDAFSKHFEEELGIYDRVLVINLVEKGGKEKVLGDSYIKNILQLNSPKVTYISFDFHVQCRGMKFDNVSILTNRLDDIIRKMGYCWVDSYGMVLKQEGTFRVNCVDCLDRTNVVQTHLAKEMITFELSKVGLIAPEIGLPSNVRMILQTLWANNGDTLSKQYAGTNALKGDFTRTGERKFAGVMKDGMNSANRYYLNRFRDTSRQAVIDLMLGVRKSVTEADLAEEKQPFEKDNGTEQIKSIIEDVKRCMIPPEEVILGAWGLVNAKINEPDIFDVDSIFVLTECNYYVTDYDCSLDVMTETQKISLTSLKTIELGSDTLPQTTTVWSIFSSSSNNSSQTLVPTMKINYVCSQEDGGQQSHEFRSSNMRFFNNVAVPILQPEEMQEALRMVSEAIKIASSAQGNPVEIVVTPSFQSSNNNKGRLPGMASNFVNSVGIAKKISASSFDKLKYFRRGSSGALPNGEIVLVSEDVEDGGGSLILSDTLEKSGQIGSPRIMKDHPNNSPPRIQDLIELTPNLLLHHKQVFPIENDLVLSSCGILSPGARNRNKVLVIEEEGDAHLLQINDSVEVPTGLIPGDSSSGEVSPSQYKEPITPTIAPAISNIVLQRHRNSLPVCSLSVTPASDGHIHTSPQRSRTPEITITEEIQSPLLGLGAEYIRPHPSPCKEAGTTFTNIPQQSLSSLKVAMRRISRSSEDVHKIGRGGFSFGIPNLRGIHTPKLPNLFNLNKNDNRSSSQQNISEAIPLKGSHSENALKDPGTGNPQQKNNSNNNQNNNNMVLAPLGKLAKGMQSLGASYLDPRKIRESLKPMVKQDSFEDKELEEKKRASETQFIEV